MTRRGFGAFCALITGAVCALSFGGMLYGYFSLLLLLLLSYSLISSLWALFTLKISHSLNVPSVFRGEQAQLLIQVRHLCPLPVAPIQGEMIWEKQPQECRFSPHPFRPHTRRFPLSARHVGQYGAQLSLLYVEDLFGLFRWRKKTADQQALLTVLPRPFDIEKPRIVLGDDGSAALARTQEDYNAPEDVRSYLPGDAMKRIHWKLSSRKRELLVRRFEVPAPPDTLIFLDCAPPQGGDDIPDGKENLRDALCETAVAVAQLQMQDGSPVRLPIYGEQANEFASDHAGNITLLQEMLALQPFRQQEDFARVLNLELRRMRRTGAAVIITSRLTAPIVEAVTRIRRMGPSARLYLCTYTPDRPEDQPLVSRLQHHLVEVCYVTPA
ncbi:MAG: DUF58 domain-containing protein [Clostridiales bacterium]|nr:DUF58 domain-containing protein [Clostridiales bacterium]